MWDIETAGGMLGLSLWLGGTQVGWMVLMSSSACECDYFLQQVGHVLGSLAEIPLTLLVPCLQALPVA
nr:hypothetical protein Itr_chr07CG14220 [Ipomoea trifida]